MDERALLERLTAHPMSGWMRPKAALLPDLSAAGRLLWCGIGGSLLPVDALLGALGGPESQHRFVALASPEPIDLRLEPLDQLVFASKSGRTLELWSWGPMARTGLMPLRTPPVPCFPRLSATS